MSTKHSRKVFKQLLSIAKFHGVFYVRPKNPINGRILLSCCAFTALLLTVSHVISLLWKLEYSCTAEFTVCFMERLRLIPSALNTFAIIYYSFFTQSAFEDLLEILIKVEDFLLKFDTNSTEKPFSSAITISVNYLIFFGLAGFRVVISLKKFTALFALATELLSLYICFHSMNVIIHTMQIIRHMYSKTSTIFRKAMVEYLTLPPEELVEVSEGKFFTSGWIKSVLEKRNDEKIVPFVVAITSIVDMLNTAVDCVNQIHGLPILVFFVIITAVSLEFINLMLVMGAKDVNEILGNIYKSFGALLCTPLLVCMRCYIKYLSLLNIYIFLDANDVSYSSMQHSFWIFEKYWIFSLQIYFRITKRKSEASRI